MFPRLSHLWLDAGYRGEDKGADWVEKTLGWSVGMWWSVPESLLPRRCLGLGPGSGPKRRCGARLAEAHATPRVRSAAEEVGSGEDVFMDRPEQDDELRDYERLPESGEAFIYVAMSRLMVRRLARS
jgi:putative transposase